MHDITHLRKLEKIRTEFVNNVSHELKTPVTAIKGFTETLLDGAMYQQDTCREFIEIIDKETARFKPPGTRPFSLINIVELHGGTVNVQSTPGVGSEFFFTLPKQN